MLGIEKGAEELPQRKKYALLLRGQARQIEELVEAIGYGFAVGASAVVVEEDDRGVFCALVGGGNPIPGAATGGGKTKARAQFLLVGQFRFLAAFSSWKPADWTADLS